MMGAEGAAKSHYWRGSWKRNHFLLRNRTVRQSEPLDIRKADHICLILAVSIVSYIASNKAMN